MRFGWSWQGDGLDAHPELQPLHPLKQLHRQLLNGFQPPQQLLPILLSRHHEQSPPFALHPKWLFFNLTP